MACYEMASSLGNSIELGDYCLQFNREKIPERIVHARGAGAHGYFEVTKDITKYSAADFLQSVGKKTPVTARLSTVVHEKGCGQLTQDPS